MGSENEKEIWREMIERVCKLNSMLIVVGGLTLDICYLYGMKQNVIV